MSEIVAQWGPKKWLVSSNKIMHIDNLSTTYKLKEDLNSSLAGKQSNNLRGMELVTLKISTKLVKYNHIKVRTQIETWKSLIGKSSPLLIQGDSFSADYFMLKEVNVTNIELNDEGTFISADLDLFFGEALEPDEGYSQETTLSNEEKSLFAKGSKVKITDDAKAFYNTDMIPEEFKDNKVFEVVSVHPKRELIGIKLDDGTTQLIRIDWVTLQP